MENKGLLFIPDISGFTRFVNETEIEHSSLIIQELLEILINSNEIGLEISEIEGDAILFYRFGEPPQLEELYGQVEKMFRVFHQNLIAYDHTRYCQCKACISVANLTLKVVTHYGEFTGYSVRNFNKLIGKDLIVAHQLLKNDIELHEYWLVTKSLMPGKPNTDLAKGLKWSSLAKQTESGPIDFHYTQLGYLKKELAPELKTYPGLLEKTKVFSCSKEFDTDIITLFHAVGSFNYRSRWLEGVKKVEEINHYLPRVGMRCRCILENGEEITYSSSYFYQEDRIEFSETVEGPNSLTYFTLEKKEDNKTTLTIDIYQEKKLGANIIFNLMNKKRTQAQYAKSLQNLVDLVAGIKLPGRVDQ